MLLPDAEHITLDGHLDRNSHGARPVHLLITMDRGVMAHLEGDPTKIARLTQDALWKTRGSDRRTRGRVYRYPIPGKTCFFYLKTGQFYEFPTLKTDGSPSP